MVENLPYMNNNKQLAVEIAQDVLLQLQQNQFKVSEQNGYFDFGMKLEKNSPLLKQIRSSDCSLQDILLGRNDDNNKPQFCNVCALGALFFSYIVRYNKFMVNVTDERRDSDYFKLPTTCDEADVNEYLDKLEGDDIIDFAVELNGHKLKTKLTEIFSIQEIKDIELFFETFRRRSSMSELASLQDKFGRKYPTPTERLVKICENIIQNDGGI